MKKTLLVFAFLPLLSCTTAVPRKIAAESTHCPPCQEAMSREEKGFHNPTFDSTFDSLIAMYPKPIPDHDGEIDDFQLLSAARAIVARDPKRVESSDRVLRNERGQNLPVEGFLRFREQLKRAFGDLAGLSEASASAYVETAVREILKASLLGESDYRSATKAPFLKQQDLSRLLRKGADELWRTSTIENRFDVPFMAGYYSDDAKFIFIDRAIPREGEFKGMKIPAHRLLNVHERVEKILLVRFGLIYQHAHQIALRLERATTIALGLDWQEYSDWTDLTSDHVSVVSPLKIHPKLDMTCYYSYDDEEALRLSAEMEEAKKKGLSAD